MTTSTTSTTTTSPTGTGTARTRVAGLWCLAAALLGVAQAAVILGWPEQVGDDRYSYPFTPAWYTTAQASFAVQHLPLALGVAALAGTAAVRASRTARLGLIAAAVGLVLLSVVEVIAFSAAHVAEDSSRGDLVNNSYAVPVLLTGTGLVVAGLALVRRRAEWSGSPLLPWLVLALGVYVFVPLSPAISASFVAGRLGIGGWMLLFAVFGAALARHDDTGSARR
jgi:hypothetical protein